MEPNEEQASKESAVNALQVQRDCLRLAQAGLQVVPVAVTAAESVERLRTWADGRCLSADRVGLYTRKADSRTRRRVQRDSSAN